jgi:hypothetical protein
MRPRLFFIAVFLITGIALPAQRANTWHFGNNAGLTFSTTPPTALSNGLTPGPDNTSTISNSVGNLLFYTNGVTVWNRNHVVMPNGSGLLGHVSAGQCALIVPIPCDTNKYVIFHVTEFSSPGYLRYSVVDMSLNNGFGDVVAGQKNISLGSNWTEKLCAYYNSAGNYYWLLSHKWQSDQFVAFRVDANSIATLSVSSAVGSIHNCGSYSAAHDAMGQLTISPDGTKVVNAVTCQDKFELFDFNVNTGAVSNLISIPGNGGNAWGTAFSPDSRKLYVNSIFGNSIYQYDLTIYTQPSIIASASAVGTEAGGGYHFGYMELGPNNKLYIAKPSTGFLSVVNNPNSLGVACNFTMLGQSLGNKTSNHGTSRIAYNIPASGNGQLAVSSSSAQICAGQSVTVSASGANTYTWNTNATTSSIVVSPSVTTSYFVSTSVCTSLSSAITITVMPTPTLAVTGPTSICYQQTVTLVANGASSYTWAPATQAQSLTVSPLVSTGYTVTGTSSLGCNSAPVVHFITVNPCESGIMPNTRNAGLKVYPSPAQQELTVEAPGLYGRLTLVNLFGQKLLSVDKRSEDPEGNIKLQVGNLPEGIYFISFETESGTMLHKWVKD